MKKRNQKFAKKYAGEINEELFRKFRFLVMYLEILLSKESDLSSSKITITQGVKRTDPSDGLICN